MTTGKSPVDHAHELNRRIQEDPARKLQIIQQFYSEMVAAGERETADLALVIRNIMEAGSKPIIPSWFQAAGFICGAFTLLFFMALVVGSIFGHVVPTSSKFLVVIVFSLGCSLAAAFLGGDAAASGNIPFISKDNPLAVSATGGIAVLIIVLLLGYYFYVK
jgi:hypothetical protein